MSALKGQRNKKIFNQKESGKTYAELAKEHGLTPQAVYNIVRRMRTQIKLDQLTTDK